MPTSKTTIDTLTATVSEGRGFVSAFRTKLEAVGFTSTSDTGQFDESAGAVNSSGNILNGHRIFRTPDSDPSHAVMPIYMKARFRTAANTPAGAVYTQIVSPHFGTGSDGASNLNDLWLPHADSMWMQIPFADVTNMWVVRNGLMGGFVIGGVDGDNYSDDAGGWFFHRTVDASGNPTTEGFYVLTFNANASAFASAGVFYNFGSVSGASFLMPGVYLQTASPNIYALPNTENYYDRVRDKWRGETHPAGGGHRSFHIPDYPSVSIDGTNAIHYPYIGNKFDGLDRPLTGLVAYHKVHHAVGDTFTLTRYGVSRTFLATALRICHASFATNKLDWRLAVLWE